MSKRPSFSKTLKKQTLAEQVADTIKEAIIAGQFAAGEALPTEPELSEQFGVSRAVVRDATRMLVAKGLVDARHGRGVFVTDSQVAAFGDALLLALRRAGATVWDVERFEQILFPEVCAEAAVARTEDEVAQLERLMSEAIAAYTELAEAHFQEQAATAAMEQQSKMAFRRFMQAIFDMTHNHVLQLLAPPLLTLRNMREWEGDGRTMEQAVEIERRYLSTLLEVIGAGDAERARQRVRALMALPAVAEAVMRQTAVGEKPQIEIPLPDLDVE